MMDQQIKLEILRQNNPFLSSSTSDPWTNDFPDVKSINREVFNVVVRTLEQKQRFPGNGIACLILGEAGSGKTHLVSRILRWLREHQKSTLFSYIQPIEDPAQTYRYLLREIVVNLCRSDLDSTTSNQFDFLLGKVLTDLLMKKVRIKQITVAKQRELIKRLKADPTFFRKSNILKKVLTSKAIAKFGKDYLLSEFPNLDEQFLNVFLSYRIDSMRTPALSWMKGAILDESETALLRVASRYNATDEFLEQEARSILVSIGQLLTKYQYRLLVCFDRMENLSSNEQVESFGKMVEFLMDQALGMLPLAFFRGQLWEEKFKHKLNHHVTSRLNTNRCVLKGCDVDAAMDIIKARLNFVFQEAGDDVYPFDEEYLRDIFSRELLSPREVIIEANERLTKILGELDSSKPPEIEKILFNEFNTQYKQLINNSGSVMPDRLRLRHTLSIYLKSFPANSPLRLNTIEFTGNSKDIIDFICSFTEKAIGDFKAAFIIDDSLHHKTVNSKLETAISFLKENQSNRAFYIRDRRSKFPGPEVWKVTNKTLNRFKDQGGVVLKLTQVQAMAWYALTFLHYKVVEGDIIVQISRYRSKSVADNEFMQFAARYLHGKSKLAQFQMDHLLLKAR